MGISEPKKTTQATSKAANKLNKSIEDSTSAIQPLTMTDVIASDCWIWQHFDGLQTAGNVQSSTQWEAMRIKDKFDRSFEKLGFLREEIQNVEIFWKKHLEWIRQTLSSLSNDFDL